MANADSKSHDFYEEWLGIPRGQRPPDHYALLGLERFEPDAGVIQRAAMNRMKLVRARCLKFPDAGTQLLNELAAARICLTDPEEKQKYDGALAAGTVPAAKPSDAAGDDLAAIDLSAYREMVNLMPSAAPPRPPTHTPEPAPKPTPQPADEDEDAGYEIVDSDSPSDDAPALPRGKFRTAASDSEDEKWQKFDERVRRRSEATQQGSRIKIGIAAVICGAALIYCAVRLTGSDRTPNARTVAQVDRPNPLVESPAAADVKKNALTTAGSMTPPAIPSKRDAAISETPSDKSAAAGGTSGGAATDAASSRGAGAPGGAQVGATSGPPSGTAPNEAAFGASAPGGGAGAAPGSTPRVGGPAAAVSRGAGAPGGPGAAVSGGTSSPGAAPGGLPGAAPGVGGPGATPGVGRPGATVSRGAGAAGAMPGGPNSPRSSGVIGAWIIDKPIDSIVNMPPLTVASFDSGSRFADARRSIEAADGNMFEAGTYHLFEIVAPGVITVQWQGHATGNNQVVLYLWDGKSWRMNLFPRYAGGLVSLTAAPLPEQGSLYVLVHCTRGTIATDFIDGVVLEDKDLEKMPGPANLASSKKSPAAPKSNDPRLQGDDNDWFVVWVRGQIWVTEKTTSRWESFLDSDVVHGKSAAATRLSEMQIARSRSKVRNLIGQGRGFGSDADAKLHKSKMDSGKK